jgi:catechol 2,3-dioxygenase-like lactoylglutathione lyase family enzyme
MTVRRVVANIAADQLEPARRFYGEVFGMTVAMDLGWILTFEAPALAAPQISVAREGGSGTSVPDLSIEVDDLYEVHRRAVAAGFEPEYGPVREPWGVTRFYMRDPFGQLVNVLSHD